MRYLVLTALWGGLCCSAARGQESQAVDVNKQSREDQAKALTDFYVTEKTEEKQEAEPLSGPSLPFSGGLLLMCLTPLF